MSKSRWGRKGGCDDGYCPHLFNLPGHAPADVLLAGLVVLPPMQDSARNGPPAAEGGGSGETDNSSPTAPAETAVPARDGPATGDGAMINLIQTGPDMYTLETATNILGYIRKDDSGEYRYSLSSPSHYPWGPVRTLQHAIGAIAAAHITREFERTTKQ